MSMYVVFYLQAALPVRYIRLNFYMLMCVGNLNNSSFLFSLLESL